MSLLSQNKSYSLVIQAIISTLAFSAILYFTKRTDFVLFFSLYTILFISYFILNQVISVKQAIGLGIMFRIIAFLSWPELSDDYYRFVWDGMISNAGINPYLFTPKHILDNNLIDSGFSNRIFESLNSPNYYSVYPPLNQLLFKISNYFSGEWSLYSNLIALKFWILVSEIGTVLLLPKVLKAFNCNEKSAVLYILNPLIIIELTGNVHFEGVMIFLLLLALYYFRKKPLLSAIFMGGAISIKLIPILFLPVMWQYLKLKKWIIYILIVGVINLLLFGPYLTAEFISNFGSSINLYFKSFQFNSFIYPIALDFSPEIIKSSIATILMVFPLLALVWFSFSKTSMLKNMPSKMGMAQSFYYFFAAVVHPWYLSTMLMLSSFHPVKYILVWSYIIGLSYFTYRVAPYEEAPFILALEYVILFTVLFIDWVQLKRKRYKTLR